MILRELIMRVTATAIFGTVLSVSTRAQELGTLQGEVAVQFWINTRPGGETIRAGNAVMSPYEFHFYAGTPRTAVSDDGTFSFDVRGAHGQHRDDYLQNDIGGPGRHQITLNCASILRGKGRLRRDGTLLVELEWIRGAGLYTNVSNTAGSAVFAIPASEAGYLSKWELATESVRTEEPSPETLRKVRSYGNQRRSTVPFEQPLPITERIGAKYTRSLGLVPRG